jgi:hypothetical protein
MEQRERGKRLVPQENTIITPIEAGCYKQKIPHRDASEEEKEESKKTACKDQTPVVHSIHSAKV